MKSILLIGLGIVIGIMVCFVAVLLVGAFGIIDAGASTNPGTLERTLAPWVVEVSREHRAPHLANPYTNAAAVHIGLNHYRENCLICHGAPQVEAGEISMGLNPAPPDLQSRGTQSMSDGELFWTIKNGIRMSGMPAFGMTHSDDDIWKIVAFLRHLSSLTPEQTANLKQAKTKEGEPGAQEQ